MQETNLRDVAEAAALDPDEIPTAVDGCGVLSFALPLERMASAFARFEESPEGRRIAAAMREHPDLIRGPKATDTLLMKRVPGAIAKGGAEGLLCGKLPDGTGFALKAADGTERALRPALAALLAPLGFDLPEFVEAPVENNHGERVGTIATA
jgi:L-asparaginase II